MRVLEGLSEVWAGKRNARWRSLEERTSAARTASLPRGKCPISDRGLASPSSKIASKTRPQGCTYLGSASGDVEP